MNPSKRGVYQGYVKAILLVSSVVLLLIAQGSSEAISPANNELAFEVLDSVIILDSYFAARSTQAYWLHVLVKKEADFIPVQIKLGQPNSTYTTISLTPNPHERCPFADRKTKDLGILAALERDEFSVYNSTVISSSGFSTRVAGLIVNIQGKLFLVDGLYVSGKCFWAQE